MLDWQQFEYLSFDCYGTLIDWEAGILNEIRPILNTYSVDLSDDDILAEFAAYEAEAEKPPYRTYRDVLKRVLVGFGVKHNFEPTPSQLNIFSSSVGRWPAFLDTGEALRTLSSYKKLAVVSNVDDSLFRETREQLGVTFDHVITAEQVGSYKPDHRVFMAMMDRVGVPNEKILHVAQSLYHDIKPAQALGLMTVWVNRRHDKTGPGATPPSDVTPDHEVPDLITLARAIATT